MLKRSKIVVGSSMDVTSFYSTVPHHIKKSISISHK